MLSSDEKRRSRPLPRPLGPSWLWQGLAALVVLGLLAARQPASSAPTIGAPAPDFRLPRLGGEELALSSLKGKAVVVNFWATWCGPCRDELPLLADLARRYPASELTVLGVNVQEGEAVVRPFAEEMGITFPLVLDKTGEVVKRYRLRGLPTTVFIDRAGIIRAVYLGPLTSDTLARHLSDLLGPTT